MLSINTSLYAQFIADINSIITTGKRIVITIYTNAEGTELDLCKDGTTPVLEKVFTSLQYKYPTEEELGLLLLSFEDGTEYERLDYEKEVWYTMNEVTTSITPFL